MINFISEDQVKDILSVKNTVELLEEAMKALSTGKAFNSPRKRLPTSYEGGNLFICLKNSLETNHSFFSPPYAGLFAGPQVFERLSGNRGRCPGHGAFQCRYCIHK